MRRSFDLLFGCVFVEHKGNFIGCCECAEVGVVAHVTNVPEFKLVRCFAKVKCICTDIFGVGIEFDISGNTAKIESV